MQKYCGCVFSELEPKIKDIKKSIENNKELNKITERKIRLNREFKGLNIRKYNNSDYDFIYNLKSKKNLDVKTNKRIVNNYIQDDTIIITLNDIQIGFYTKEIYLICEYQDKGIEEIIIKELNN